MGFVWHWIKRCWNFVRRASGRSGRPPLGRSDIIAGMTPRARQIHRALKAAIARRRAT